MDFTTISKASDKILTDLLDDKAIQDEILLELIAEVIKYIRSGLNGKIPIAFFRLAEYVNNFMQSDEINHKPTNIVLAYGKIWSITSTVDIFESCEQREKEIEIDAKRYEDKCNLFRTIRDHSGIAHRELAEAVGMSPSSLSQFMNRMDRGKYFMYRVLGRGKYYFITDTGKALINKMEENCRNRNLKKFFKPSKYNYIEVLLSNDLLKQSMGASDKALSLKETARNPEMTNFNSKLRHRTVLIGETESSSRKEEFYEMVCNNARR